MKTLKSFVSTFYSEHLLSSNNEEEGKFTTSEGSANGHHAGLGAVYKYPGDPRKLREKSKVKLWKEYLTRMILSLAFFSESDTRTTDEHFFFTS